MSRQAELEALAARSGDIGPSDVREATPLERAQAGMGESSYGDLQEKGVIHEHGELGPMLLDANHDFTSEADIKRGRGDYPPESE